MRTTRFWITALLVAGATSLPAQYEPLAQDRGVVGLGLSIRRLGVTGSLLYITAHPDDENNGLLVKLGVVDGMRTGLLTLTRGEGGQNEIGPELGEAIGVLRTEEVLAVHRYDGAEQFFSKAYEFGYSFSVEETFEKWGEEPTLGDIVRVIRTFRPDVIVTMMPTGAGGGQHHQASARLALRAFRIAADASRFPDQIEAGLRPWQTKKIYHAPFVRPGQTAPERALVVDVGELDPLLGLSPAEIGAIARNSHRCQGMNASPRPGPRAAFLLPAGDTGGDTPFDGVDVSLGRIGRLAGAAAPPFLQRGVVSLEGLVDSARSGYRERDFTRLAATACAAYTLVNALRRDTGRTGLDPDVRASVDAVLAREAEDWKLVAERSVFLTCDAVVGETERGHVPDGLVAPGETFDVLVTLLHQASRDFSVRRVRLSAPAGWRVESRDEITGLLPGNTPGRWRFRVTVPPNASPTGPHWRRPSSDSFRHETIGPPGQSIAPFPAASLSARVDYRLGEVELSVERPVVHRWYDPAAAKRRSMAIKVVPALNVRVEPELVIVAATAEDRSRQLRVSVENKRPGATEARVRLEVPAGWTCAPAEHVIVFARQNEKKVTRFTVTPPGDFVGQVAELRAVAGEGETEHRRGYRTISYHHIETRHLYREAVATLRSIDMRCAAGLRVGYVMGVGDDVPAAIEALGASVDLLDAEALATGDLTRFDAIVTGIRAYKDRGDLIAHNARLLEWVERGGLMLVQYNKYELNAAAYGPFPLEIHRPHDRVTDENAPVKVLLPGHQAFRWPNRIGESDWNGWVQERGLYFLGAWDSRYSALLEIEDPFPYNRGKKRGALLLGRHGKGTWIYTGLGFFRQLPAGVPGAYRLFANLLSLARRPGPR